MSGTIDAVSDFTEKTSPLIPEIQIQNRRRTSLKADYGTAGVLESAADVIERPLRPLNRWMFILSALTVGIMSVPIFLDVLSRFFLSKSVSGVIECEEFMMVVIVFLALGLVQFQKEHVQIDLLLTRLPQWTHSVFDTFNWSVCAVLFGVMTWRIVLQVMKKMGEFSFSLGIPISIFIGVSAFGAAILTLGLLANLLRDAAQVIKNGRWAWLVPALAASAGVLLIPVWIEALPWEPSRLALGGMGMAFLMALLLVRMPIGYAMAVVGFLGMSIVSIKMTAALSILGIAPYATTASFILAVAPLFILMGELAFHAGISQDLFDAAYKWLGRLPGGLAMSAVAGCSGFAAVCGDSMSTAVTMGTVALPEMEKKNYSPSLACGALAAGGTLGILIPPSIGFIFYAIITEESVGKLFIAGILPGAVLAVLFMTAIYLIAKVRPETAPRGEATTFKEKVIALKGEAGMLILFVVILGGILAGTFSPTEGGAVGAVGAFVFALARRRLTREKLFEALRETAVITTKLLMILIGVGILGYFLAATRLPFELAELVTGLAVNRYLIFAAVIALFVVLGCLMNVIPMILLTLPAIYPTIIALNFDPIWFGVVTVIVMEMGQITPPIGVNVFALSSVAKDIPMEIIFKGVLPFFLAMVLSVVILVIWPELATFLPGIFF